VDDKDKEMDLCPRHATKMMSNKTNLFLTSKFVYLEAQEAHFSEATFRMKGCMHELGDMADDGSVSEFNGEANDSSEHSSVMAQILTRVRHLETGLEELFYMSETWMDCFLTNESGQPRTIMVRNFCADIPLNEGDWQKFCHHYRRGGATYQVVFQWRCLNSGTKQYFHVVLDAREGTKVHSSTVVDFEKVKHEMFRDGVIGHNVKMVKDPRVRTNNEFR